MQERAGLYRARTGPAQDLYRDPHESCTGPVWVPVQIPYITHIMAAQVWHRHRTRSVRGLHKNRTGPVQVLCRACAGPVQDLCKTVGHICPSRPLSVKVICYPKFFIWGRFCKTVGHIYPSGPLSVNIQPHPLK